MTLTVIHMRPLHRIFKVLSLLILCLLLSATSANAELRILILGDSIAAGYGLPTVEALPYRLEQALRQESEDPTISVTNAGVSGDTTAGGLARLEWLLSETPSAVIIALGGNDTLRGLKPDFSKINLQKILEILRQRKIPSLLVGMRAPRNMGADFAARFDQLFPALAAEYDVLFMPFLLEGVAAVPALNQPDGIHPNPQGIAKIVQEMMPLALKLLNQAREQKG